jgi:hypothetical protein
MDYAQNMEQFQQPMLNVNMMDSQSTAYYAP